MPVAAFVLNLVETNRSFLLQERLAAGLSERELVSSELCEANSSRTLGDRVDAVFSFGGDGTLLNTVHELNGSQTPVLGVNLGRLGFLAPVEVAQLNATLVALESGNYSVEDRMVLEASVSGENTAQRSWALNEFTVQGSSMTGLLAIEVHIDDTLLNIYWADGLIIATPTGSTAYSLAVGGPIIAPTCNNMLISAVAPHTLSVRPVVLRDDSVLDIRVLDEDKKWVFTRDGMTDSNPGSGSSIRIRKADHVVRLIRPAGNDYFETLRAKLMWGARKA